MSKEEKYHRRSIRLPDYDYSRFGYYFVTICTYNREYFFGDVKNGGMILNEIGTVAKQCWLDISKHYPDVKLDEFIIMPNHVHGIIIIDIGAQNSVPQQNVGAQNSVPLQLPNKNQFQHIMPRSLGSIIRGFKIGVIKWCRQNGYGYFQWQRNYYEHIIRNEKSYWVIKKYIRDNPLNWLTDEENPAKIRG